MTNICISGTCNSDASILAHALGESLDYTIGVTGAAISVNAMAWYHEPKAYSIFCMKSVLDRNDAEWVTKRQEVLEQYKVDIEDMRNYDLVIDTSQYQLSDILPTILSCYRYGLRGAILCGNQCLPTETAIEMSKEVYESSMVKQKFDGTPIVAFADFTWYLLDGHARMYAMPTVPYICHVKTGVLRELDVAQLTFEEMLGIKFDIKGNS